MLLQNCHHHTAAPPASLTPLHPSANYSTSPSPAGHRWSSAPHCPSSASLLGLQRECKQQEERALHIPPLTLPFPRQKFKQDLSRRGSGHLPRALLAIVAPLLHPRQRVFAVTKCKSHFPPSWQNLSLHSILPLFSSPQLVLQCSEEFTTPPSSTSL